MSLSEEILEKLLCSKCHMYLSVQPVKVYPDRSVQCGRCNRFLLPVDDGGVESFLYKAVVGNLKFPCVNRYEGCNELLGWSSNVWEHEEKCCSEVFNCRACSKFQGSSYYLQRHIKEKHQDQILTEQEFILELDKGNQTKVFFYIENNFLLCILCHFDPTTDQLFLDISTPFRRRAEPLKHQFLVYSIDGSVKCKSAVTKCSDYDRIQGEGHLFYISTDEFSKSVMLLRFEVKSEPSLYLEKNQSMFWNLHSCIATWRYTFNELSKLTVGKKLSSTNFYLASLPWKIFIVKISNSRPNAVNIYLTLLEEKICNVNVVTKLVPTNTLNVLMNGSNEHSRGLDLMFHKEGFNQYQRVIYTAGDISSALGYHAEIDDSLTVEIDIKVDLKTASQDESSNSGHINKKIKASQLAVEDIYR